MKYRIIANGGLSLCVQKSHSFLDLASIIVRIEVKCRIDFIPLHIEMTIFRGRHISCRMNFPHQADLDLDIIYTWDISQKYKHHPKFFKPALSIDPPDGGNNIGLMREARTSSSGIGHYIVLGMGAVIWNHFKKLNTK